jgi:ectoine hydroxylase-related dioxygenase (phytanoyl-CoA dioxygenase family)
MTPAAGALDRYAEELERDGICVIPGLLPPALIHAWAGAFAALFADRAARPGGLAPRERERFYLTLPWTPPFDDPRVFANPTILGILDRVFAQEYVLVQLAADTPRHGSEYQPIHRDFRPLFHDDFVTPLYALAVNVPLVEVTPDRGPFEMARGTHRLPKEEALARIARGELAMEPFLMAPGDVMIRTPLALHRGTPNRTDTPRPMVVLGYVMHWLHTPKVELRVPRAAWTALPERQRRLLRCELVESLEYRPESYVDFKY